LDAAVSAVRDVRDADVLPLLREAFPMAVQLYGHITIPAARADVARLLLLHAHGGMYVGSHLGVVDARPLREAHGLLDRYDGVLIERFPRLPGLEDGQRSFVNMVMLARARSPWLLEVCARAVENLASQWTAQRSGEAPAYSIWQMTGPGLLTRTVSTPDLRSLLPAFAEHLTIRTEAELGLRREQFRAQTGDAHWSIRERQEPLFQQAC
jgi:mannosyltransferase OCH1-like enzyme